MLPYVGSNFVPSYQHVISEPFEPSPFMPGDTRVFEDDFNPIDSKLEREADADASISLPMNEKENSTRENNVAKIKVVVCQNSIDTYAYLCVKHLERSDFPCLAIGTFHMH